MSMKAWGFLETKNILNSVSFVEKRMFSNSTLSKAYSALVLTRIAFLTTFHFITNSFFARNIFCVTLYFVICKTFLHNGFEYFSFDNLYS